MINKNNIIIDNKDVLFTWHSTKENYIIFNFKTSFRNKKWANYFGMIQAVGKSGKFNNNPVYQILIDISNCYWIDPLPILSLLIFTNINSEKYKISVRIPELNKTIEQDRVLKFIAKQGFFDFQNLIQIFDKKGIIKQDKISRYVNSAVSLNYSNSDLFKFTVVDLNQIDKEYKNIEYWLDPLIEEAKTKLIGFVQENQIDHLLYKIKLFLGETLHNVKKHAYPEEKKAYAGFFGRIRFGLENQSISNNEKEIIAKSINGEKKHCPRLEPEFIKMNPIFIELFITDLGIGMSESMRDVLRKKKDDEWTFRDVCKAVFIEGKKSNKSADFTEFGGLYTLGNFFRNNFDYLCGRDVNEWVGDFLPFNYKNSYAQTDCNRYKRPNLDGLSWIGRISPTFYKRKDEINWTYWYGSPKMHPVYKEMNIKQQFISKEIIKYLVVDNRPFVSTELINHFIDVQREEVGVFDEQFILLFSKKNLSKTGVWLQLENLSKEYNLKPKNRTLYIVDILDNEKHSYIAALNNPKLNQRNWPLNFSNIFLITKNFDVCILELTKENDSLSYTIQQETSDLYYDYSNSTESFSPNKFLSHLYRWIRSYESILFWKYLSLQNFQNRMFINSDVEWNNDLPTIKGYLNFSQTLSNDFFKKIYKQNIERCIGFFDDGICIFKNMDVLTASLVEEVNSDVRDVENIEKENNINIGSVFVTGSMEKEAQFGAKNVSFTLNIHFFIHSDSRNNSTSFFNWPEKDWFESNDLKYFKSNYKRVGRSHVIAKFGWKYFSIPRYMPNGESFYYRNPTKTYEDWQSSYYRLIKIGNFRYNQYYDLFKIDLRRAILMSFEFEEELSKFLIEEFLYALHGNKEKHLTDHGKIFTDRIDLNCQEKKNFYENIIAIIYPSHSNTSYAIEKIKECIKSEITNKIFPLIPIKDKRDGSALIISPLVFDSIESLIKEKTGHKEILFFDDSIVSGRTRKELKHIMIGLGAHDIKTLTILDRNRLPFQLPSEKSYRAYWRLDVPRLGDHDNNPINKVLIELSRLENLLIDPIIKYRIRDIKAKWKGIYQYQDSSNVGLNPTKIDIKNGKNYKRFGIEKTPPHNQIGGNKNLINIKTSIGLTIYATEAHAITGKDDLALKFCKDEDYNLSNAAKIELIGAQLLLFENEYPKEVHFELVKELFYSSLSISKANNHTAFSIIVILAQDKFYHEKLIEEIKSNLDVIESSEINLNYDLIILLSYFYQNYTDKIKDDKIFFQLEITFRESQQLNINTFTELHYEIYDSSGKLHDTPILRLCESYGDSVKYRLNKVRFSFVIIKGILSDKLKGCIPRTDYCIIQDDYISEFDNKSDPFQLKNSLLQDLDKYFNKTQEILGNVIFNNDGTPKLEEHQLKIDNLIIDVKKKLLSQLRLFHSSLTYPLRGILKIERPFEDKLIELIKDIDINRLKEEALKKGQGQHTNKEIKISMSNRISDMPNKYFNYKNVWIPFETKIENQIRDILYNSIYASNEITDFWNQNSSELADLWITVFYKEDLIRISFLNAKEKLDINRVKKDFLNNRKHIKKFLTKKMKCKFNFTTLTHDEGSACRLDFDIPIINK